MAGADTVGSDVNGAPEQMTDLQTIPVSKPTKAIEEVSYITTGSRKVSKKAKTVDEDEPLIDTTAALLLRSKKTERAQKRMVKKQQKAAERPAASNLLDLPPELLEEVLGYLRPSDIGQLLFLNHDVHDFVQSHGTAVARDTIGRRYWVLTRCFPLPIAFQEVESSAHSALLSEKRQDMLQIHKKPNQHVKGINPHDVCTCMNCVFAWNNLCLILDLSHWQENLEDRKPIPMIPRGTSPEWNRKLLDANARLVEKAMNSQLCYAAILEKHLQTTIGTILRTTSRGKKTIHPRRLYHLTPAEAAKETDAFLEISGPPSYEFPWHRDNYYGLEAYMPNRKWSKEKERWLYYADGLHDRDLQWVKESFNKALDESIKSFKSQATL